MSPKHVLHLSSVHPTFDQRIFHKECQTLAKAGYQVTLIVPASFREQTRDGVRVVGVPRPRRRWQRPLTWIRLLRAAIQQRPDVVHVHDPELLLLVPFLRLLLGRRVRIIYDVHEYFVDSIAHKVWIPPHLRRPVAWLARMLERLLGQNVDGLIFVVEEQQPYYDGWPAERVVVRNFPIAAAFADPNPIPDFGVDRFRLVYIGALFKRRGIMVLLESLTQVVAQVPETLLILGGNFESTQFRTRVERFILDHNLTTNVLLLDRVEYTRLKDILAGSDVAWLPGLQVQQYQMRSISTKLLECMLMGLPIVSSDHPHRREFVAQAGCGLLVAAADPQAHAEAILWLYRHPEERKAMGQRGRQLVDNSYTWERETLALLSFYDRLLTLEAT